MVRFKIILLTLLGLLTGTAGWLWLGAESERGATAAAIGVQSSSTPSNVGGSLIPPLSKESLPERGDPSPALRFRPGDGDLLAYRFELSAQARIALERLLSGSAIPLTHGKGAQEMQVSCKGVLRLKFYPRSSDSWDVAALIDALDYRVNGEKPYWLEALGYPFTFRMSSQGVIDHFEFTKGIPTVAQELTRDILTLMQVVLPEAGRSSWETREIDITGRYRALYSLKGIDRELGQIELQKRKTDYLSTRMADNPINGSLAHSPPRIEHAEAKITLPLSGGWLQSIDYAEVSSTASNGREWSSGERFFFAETIEFRGEGDFPQDLAAFRARLSSEKFLDAQAYQTDPELDRLGAGLPIAGAIEIFRRLRTSASAEERRLAEKFLVNYLRQHPSAAFDLVSILDISTDREIDVSTQLVLWRLLTEAGHREAQQALALAAAGQGYSELTRWRALTYAHDFDRPVAELVNELWKVRKAPELSSAELQDMALYALGTLGGRENISEDLGRRLQQQLRAELASSRSVPEQAAALAAIGNSGSPEMIEAITPYLSSPDAQIRSAACDALRRMSDPRATQILMDHYRRETSPSVRQTAVETLARLPANPESVQWARQEVLRASDAEAQLAMVRILGESLKEFPANEAALRELLAHDPARNVKREVYRFIEPQ